MIVFKTVRENLTTLGSELYQPGRHLRYQLGRMKFLIVQFLNFVSFILYAFYGANDFPEYINTIFLSSIQLFAFLSAFNCIWNAENMHKLLNKIEETIIESKRSVALIRGFFYIF